MEASFVTIMFTDLVGSAALFERHEDEAADVLRREHFAALRRAVADHAGREVKSTGDGLMVAFASAAAAVRCAVAMQRDTAAAPGGLLLRVGLDAGEPIAEGEDLYGTPVIVASRLCDAAGPGQVLASDVVRQVAGRRVEELMRATARIRIKGLSEPVSVAEVVRRAEQVEDGAAVDPASSPAGAPIRVVIADDQRLEQAVLVHDPSLGAPPEPAASPTVEAGPPTPRRRSRRTALVAAAAAVGVLVVAAGAVVIDSSGHDEPASLVPVRGDSLAAVRPASGRVTDVVAVGRAPTSLSVGEGAVWVVNADDQTISRVDRKTLSTRVLAIGSTPTDVAAGAGAVWVGAGGGEGDVGAHPSRVLRLDPDAGAVRAP